MAHGIKVQTEKLSGTLFFLSKKHEIKLEWLIKIEKQHSDWKQRDREGKENLHR
jgi:hypothetical protein